ncbi:hypothetical protein N7456_007431 [Penicillium angulare]|uniref:Uncharacterized protein n=1 Tax=Penicillium angulare TaxID=116970 RepID=A0A9W9FAJ6_9EURO|nr:hypothetical protein N7456_007431 [Penicillium angulare]
MRRGPFARDTEYWNGTQFSELIGISTAGYDSIILVVNDEVAQTECQLCQNGNGPWTHLVRLVSPDQVISALGPQPPLHAPPLRATDWTQPPRNTELSDDLVLMVIKTTPSKERGILYPAAFNANSDILTTRTPKDPAPLAFAHGLPLFYVYKAYHVLTGSKFARQTWLCRINANYQSINLISENKPLLKAWFYS